MARYLNPIQAQANVAINTAAQVASARFGSITTDIEVVATVDAICTFGLPGLAAADCNQTAGTTTSHFLPAYVPRGFSVAGNSRINVLALSGNGSIWISEMG